jgi:UDP-perosamine 4-acetyltransferase
MTESKKILLIAGGGHGRVILDALLAAKIRVHGIVDSAIPVGTELFGVKVLGGDEYLDQLSGDLVLLANGLGANPKTLARSSLYQRFSMGGFHFVTIVHPSAIIGSNVKLSDGCQIMAGTVIQCGVEVGHNSVINTRASIDHDVVIGDSVFIAPGVTVCGGVNIGPEVFIGAGATILPGVRIGAGTIVGAGSLVLSDIPEGRLYSGARTIEKKGFRK